MRRRSSGPGKRVVSIETSRQGRYRCCSLERETKIETQYWLPSKALAWVAARLGDLIIVLWYFATLKFGKAQARRRRGTAAACLSLDSGSQPQEDPIFLL